MADEMGKTLTVAMIVRDEEDYIHRALESAKNIADEVVLVDTGSTDETINIALAMDVIPERYIWDGNYSNARNHAIRQSTCDWILMLDADERIIVYDDPRLQLRTTSPDVAAYKVNIISPTRRVDGEPIIETSTLFRLFRNNLGIEYRGRIHESIGKSLLALDKHGYKLMKDIEIAHLGYDKPKKEFRAFLYERIQEHHKCLEENDQDGNTWFHLGKLYELAARPDLAENCFRFAIRTKELTAMRELEVRAHLSSVYRGAN